ncbi:MAG: patatin family protein [Oscillospiraceae bacterium]
MFNAGLVLEGGGMRGLFTAGVLDFFLEKQVEFEEIIAVSAGACHACCFISKQHGRAKAVSLDYLNNKHYCGLYSLFTTGDLFGAKFVYDDIPNKLNLFDNDTFENSQSKLFATVTNVQTGQAEYLLLKNLRQGNDINAVRASASLPIVSNIVQYNTKFYLDGGMADSIPIKKAQADGYLKNVIVLTQPKSYLKLPNKAVPIIKHKYKQYPNLINAIANRHINYNDTCLYINSQEESKKVFVIRPKENLSVRRIEKDREKLESTYNLGYEAAKEKYEDMIKFLSE